MFWMCTYSASFGVVNVYYDNRLLRILIHRVPLTKILLLLGAHVLIVMGALQIYIDDDDDDDDKINYYVVYRAPATGTRSREIVHRQLL